MTDRLDEIAERLDRGIFPAEADVRWLIGQLRQDRDTIQVFTDAVMTLAQDVIRKLGDRQVIRRQEFNDHAGQFIDT